MSDLSEKRIAFILSHPFHYLIYKSLIRELPNRFVVVEKRPKTPFEFSEDFLAGLPCPHIVLEERHLRKLDQMADVIFCMTPKHLQKNFRLAKTVAVQYGMAKEYYNFGLWRCLADVNLMYGPYSHDCIKGHALSVPVGNLRFDDFRPKSIGGDGVLYMPTYGELSSLSTFIEALPNLPESLPLKVKLHHASEFQDQELIEKLRGFPNVQILDAYTDAAQDVAAADLVVSDYSGAIFDAVFLERPLLLLQPPTRQSVRRTGVESIEIGRGHEFGKVVHSAEELTGALREVEANGYPQAQAVDLNRYFSNRGHASEAAVEALQRLLRGEITRGSVQESLRGTYRSLRRTPGLPTKPGKLLKLLLKSLKKKAFRK